MAQPWTYGHDHTLYLRQLGRTYVVNPDMARPFLAGLPPRDQVVVAAEVALARAAREEPVVPMDALHDELFGGEP